MAVGDSGMRVRVASLSRIPSLVSLVAQHEVPTVRAGARAFFPCANDVDLLYFIYFFMGFGN